MGAIGTFTPLHAKDIPESLVFAMIKDSGYITRYDLQKVTRFPLKVVTAKLAKLVKRKKLDGCGGVTCDCGTPFSLRGE